MRKVKEVEIQVRYSETDQMRVAYHANYFVWFNVARDALLKDLGVEVRDAEKSGYLFPVIEAGCSYKYPARYGDELVVRAEAEESTVAKLAVYYKVIRRRDRRLLAEGKTINVLTDKYGKLIFKFPEALYQRGNN